MYLTSSEVMLFCETPIIGAFHSDVNICAASSSVDTGSARSRDLDTMESLDVYLFAQGPVVPVREGRKIV